MDNDTKLINLALDAGEIMLKNGAETFRVQDTMKRILSTTGREKIEATAISTALIVTLPREEKGPLSMMRGVRTRTINFEKVCEVNDMSRAFVSGKISLDEAIERLKEIHQFSFYPLPRFRLRSDFGLLLLSGYALLSGWLHCLCHRAVFRLSGYLAWQKENPLFLRAVSGWCCGSMSCLPHSAALPLGAYRHHHHRQHHAASAGYDLRKVHA